MNAKPNTSHTKIAPCTCNHKSQDELHGKGNRVHNPCIKGFRCTVCRKETPSK